MHLPGCSSVLILGSFDILPPLIIISVPCVLGLRTRQPPGEAAQPSVHGIPRGNQAPREKLVTAQKWAPISIKETLHRMEQSGFQMDSSTCASLLRSCKALSDGKLVHEHITRNGQVRNVFLGALLVQMYGKCGALEDAWFCFAEVHERDVLMWNLMIGASVKHGQGNETLQLFKRMQWEGVIPDKVTFVSILSACATLSGLAEGKRMHACINCCGLGSDVVIGTALLSMYSKCDSLKDALRMFDNMPNRNVVTWNAIISATAQRGHVHKVCCLFEQMQEDGVTANKVTLLTILDVCAIHGALAEGTMMHTYIMCSGLDLNIVLGTALVNLYSKCDSLEDARMVFEKLPEKDVVLWSSLMAAYTSQGHGMHVQQLFTQMKQEGVMPDKVTFVSVLDACASQADVIEGKRVHSCITLFLLESDVILATSLVNMYGKCGRLETARSVFDTMLQRNVVSWNAMLSAYSQHGKGKEACQLCNHMQHEGVVPNYVTFASLLDACASQALLAEGKGIHDLCVYYGVELHIVVTTALVNMYSKCGILEDAECVFGTMEEQNAVSWTAIISAFAQHGHGSKAFQLFNQMQEDGIRPDEVTFISILSACSHAGLLNEASHWLTIMTQHGITPSGKHYECLIDLLGRAGQLDKAEEVINEMPFSPTAVTWTALLASCRNQIDVDRGERIARRMFELDPENSGSYITLSNLYTAASMRDDAERVALKAEKPHIRAE